jgi:hypothetical protein
VKRVYIAHPLRGDVEGNQKKVDEICKSIKEDVRIFSPLHAWSFVDAAGCQRKVLADCIAELANCDELWVYGDAKAVANSSGMLTEIQYAKAVGIPVVDKNGAR